MNFSKYGRWLGALLIALGGLMGGLAGLGPAAMASIPIPPGGGPAQPVGQTVQPVHVVVAGGMPGWQIALIAIAASVVTAAVAVLIDRLRAGRLAVPAH